MVPPKCWTNVSPAAPIVGRASGLEARSGWAPAGSRMKSSPMSDASLFLKLAASMTLVAAAGQGIRIALDAWIRLAPAGAAEEVAEQ